MCSTESLHGPSRNPARREYDELAPRYDSRWRSYIDATLDLVAHELPLSGHERILDVACGTGELEKRLLEHCPELFIVGADLSLGMLRQALNKDLSDDARWIQSDAASLPFGDASFDCVICANSFHYFSEPLFALREIRRVLRPGGWLVLVDWCDDYIVCKLCSLWLHLTDPAFHRTYSLRGCRSLLENDRWEVAAAQQFRVRWIWGLMRLDCRRPDESAGSPCTP